jgi:hypothetical protein
MAKLGWPADVPRRGRSLARCTGRVRMAKYQDTPGSATEAQRLNFGYGQTALIESERIKRQIRQSSCCTAQ